MEKKLLILLILLIISASLNVYLTLFHLLGVGNLKEYEVEISEVHLPREGMPDTRILRVLVINYSEKNIDSLPITIRWYRGDEVFHEENIKIDNIDAKSYFIYDYVLKFDGFATKITYTYNGITKSFHPIQ